MKRRLVLILSTIATIGTICLWVASLNGSLSTSDENPDIRGRHVRIDCFDGMVKITCLYTSPSLRGDGNREGMRISGPGLLFLSYPEWDSGIRGPVVDHPRDAAVLQISLWWLLLLAAAMPMYRLIPSLLRSGARGVAARRVFLASSFGLAAMACLVLGYSGMSRAPRVLSGSDDGRLMLVRDSDAWCLLFRYGQSWQRSIEASIGDRRGEVHLITPSNGRLINPSNRFWWKGEPDGYLLGGFGMSTLYLPRSPLYTWGFGRGTRDSAPRPWNRSAFYWNQMNTGALRRTFEAPAWFVSSVLFLLPLTMIGKPILLKWRRRGKGLCLKCGYNLTGNVTGVCPECGTALRSRGS